MSIPQPGGGWAEIREALDTYAEQHLIISWREIPGRGLVVIAGDMAELELKSERDAGLFLGGLSSADCTIRTGKIKTGGEDAEAKLAAIAERCAAEHGNWIRIPSILAIIGSKEEARDD